MEAPFDERRLDHRNMPRILVGSVKIGGKLGFADSVLGGGLESKHTPQPCLFQAA
jgi:hypothetical protein